MLYLICLLTLSYCIIMWSVQSRCSDGCRCSFTNKACGLWFSVFKEIYKSKCPNVRVLCPNWIKFSLFERGNYEDIISENSLRLESARQRLKLMESKNSVMVYKLSMVRDDCSPALKTILMKNTEKGLQEKIILIIIVSHIKHKCQMV